MEIEQIEISSGEDDDGVDVEDGHIEQEASRASAKAAARANAKGKGKAKSDSDGRRKKEKKQVSTLATSSEFELTHL